MVSITRCRVLIAAEPPRLVKEWLKIELAQFTERTLKARSGVASAVAKRSLEQIKQTLYPPGFEVQ